MNKYPVVIVTLGFLVTFGIVYAGNHWRDEREIMIRPAFSTIKGGDGTIYKYGTTYVVDKTQGCKLISETPDAWTFGCEGKTKQ